MKINRATPRSGIALIIVMICITVLGSMAALFAVAMKVETKLAMNAKAEAEFYPLAQSAVDYCKAILAVSCPEEQFDAETQVWAGGTTSACSNELFTFIKPSVDLGYGKFTWKMTDLERKANINIADQPMLDQAMRLLGVDGGDSSAITASILDWIDRDKNPHVGGAESDYYESLDPPYKAKDGYMDDISELLLVRGVTPELYGVEGQNAPPPPSALRDQLQLGFQEPPIQRATLKELFTPISSGPININTASATVLQLVPYIDENIAQRIIGCRSGQETGQPTPFRNVGEALMCAGLNSTIIGQIQRYFSVRSMTFEVQIEVEIGSVKRHYYAILRRNSPRDVQVLSFYWKLNPPASHADAR